MAQVQYQAVGRRKKAIARVRLVPGDGKVVINGRDIDNYFGLETLKMTVRQPLALTNLEGRYDVLVNVYGGGLSGQAGAIRHGIARALVKADPELRPAVKKAGFLTRDPRMKERKKYGLIATVLLQPGESNGLGAIAGGAETFFGKNKAKSMEGKLALATKVSAGVFIICALIVAMIG